MKIHFILLLGLTHAYLFNLYDEDWPALAKDEYIWSHIMYWEGWSDWWWFPFKFLAMYFTD